MCLHMQTQQREDYLHEDEKDEASRGVETIGLDPDAPELPPPFNPDTTPPRPLPVYQEVHNEIPAREPNECIDNSALDVCSGYPRPPKPLPIYQDIAELSTREAPAKPDECVKKRDSAPELSSNLLEADCIIPPTLPPPPHPPPDYQTICDEVPTTAKPNEHIDNSTPELCSESLTTLPIIQDICEATAAKPDECVGKPETSDLELLHEADYAPPKPSPIYEDVADIPSRSRVTTNVSEYPSLVELVSPPPVQPFLPQNTCTRGATTNEQVEYRIPPGGTLV